MKESDFIFEFEQLKEKLLLPFLVGRVFHVTNLNNLKGIIESGEIRPNIKGDLPTTFGSSSNSFFRKRGCISVFDYRLATTEQIEESLRKCSPCPVDTYSKELAYLFLLECLYDRLILWTKWKEEETWGQMIVPYVESGLSGPIPIELIDDVFRVIIHRTSSPFMETFIRAKTRHRLLKHDS
jgi:hypothetical protein